MARPITIVSLPTSSVPRLCGDGPPSHHPSLKLGMRSPPVRGWPARCAPHSNPATAFPACAGMARDVALIGAIQVSVPRLCGDGPRYKKLAGVMQLRSPPVRGWPDQQNTAALTALAFPACAGMARNLKPCASSWTRVPRLCGDGPVCYNLLNASAPRSPPVRGWPASGFATPVPDVAFPACAGMARN